MTLFTAIIAIIRLSLGLANGWLQRQDDEKLRQAGATEQIALASLDLLRTLEKANAVDHAVLNGTDTQWMRELRKKYTAGTPAGGVLPSDHPGHDHSPKD